MPAVWSLFTFFTPAAAANSTFALLLARVMLGVGEGVAFPAIHSLISRNVPSDKQTTAVGIVTAASYAGTALAFGVSPLIISRLGWEVSKAHGHACIQPFGCFSGLWCCGTQSSFMAGTSTIQPCSAFSVTSWPVFSMCWRMCCMEIDMWYVCLQTRARLPVPD